MLHARFSIAESLFNFATQGYGTTMLMDILYGKH